MDRIPWPRGCSARVKVVVFPAGHMFYARVSWPNAGGDEVGAAAPSLPEGQICLSFPRVEPMENLTLQPEMIKMRTQYKLILFFRNLILLLLITLIFIYRII